MTLPERALSHLRGERSRKLEAIKWLSTDGHGIGERHDGGEWIDTTGVTIETHKEHIAEIEAILSDAGIPFDA